MEWKKLSHWGENRKKEPLVTRTSQKIMEPLFLCKLWLEKTQPSSRKSLPIFILLGQMTGKNRCQKIHHAKDENLRNLSTLVDAQKWQGFITPEWLIFQGKCPPTHLQKRHFVTRKRKLFCLRRRLWKPKQRRHLKNEPNVGSDANECFSKLKKTIFTHDGASFNLGTHLLDFLVYSMLTFFEFWLHLFCSTCSRLFFSRSHMKESIVFSMN